MNIVEIKLKNGQATALKKFIENDNVVLYNEERQLGSTYLLELFACKFATENSGKTVLFIDRDEMTIEYHVSCILNGKRNPFNSSEITRFFETNSIVKSFRKNEINFSNESKIIFETPNNCKNLTGLYFDLIIIDNGEFVGDYEDIIISDVIPRLKKDGKIISKGRPFSPGSKSAFLTKGRL